jgi:outer membrane protein assembly factor BamB
MKIAIHALAGLALVLLQIGAASEPGRAGEAVAYQINPAHDGSTSFTRGFSPPLTRKWVRDLGSQVSYPVIANGLVFVTVAPPDDYSSAKLFALDLETGRTVWRKAIKDGLGNLAYDNGRLFLMSYYGVMSAFAADRLGTRAWRKRLPAQTFFTAPTAHGGQVFVSGAGLGATLCAVDESTGAIQWTGQAASGSHSSPTLGDGGLYLTFPANYYKVDPTDGHLIWHVARGGGGGGGNTPVYYRGRLYVRDWALSDVVLNTDSGTVMTSLAASAPPTFWMDSTGRRFEITLFNRRLYSVDIRTGNVVWSFSGDDQLTSAPIVINDGRCDRFAFR